MSNINQNQLQELLEETDKESNQRIYPPKLQRFLGIVLIGWTIFQVYFNLTGTLDAITFRAYHAMFLIGFTFLIFPIGKKDKRIERLPLADGILLLLGVGSFLYMILNYQRVATSGGFLSNTDIAIAGIGIVVALLAGKRAAGNLAWLALIFFLYNFFGKYIPGVFGHNGFTIRRVIGHLFWGSQGIFGVGLGVSTSYIFLFVVFGAFLKKSGFSNFLNDLAGAAVGHSPGGPAKVAVIASALLGMMNGSAVANVATTGTITIPMMKKNGYSKEFAAAVEAVASTGGQFAPPIMGAVGFVMAEYLGVSYTVVMLSAVIPALLYYLGILFSVHLEAKKLGLKGLSKDSLPNIKELLKAKGHLSLPLFVLVGMMFAGFSALYAGVVGIFSTIIASYLRKQTRMSFADIGEACVEGARSAISVGMSCVMIGIIIGTVSLSGLGLNFGQWILRYVGEGQLLLGGIFVMLMSTVLGMGVPGVAAYIIVATVSVPILIEGGATPIAAHLFCLMYACLSNITPPVAISSYVASGIAGSDETRTSLIAVKLGLTGFLIPFFFLNNPVLLLGQSTIGWLGTIQAAATALLGVLCLAFAAEGIMFGKLSVATRLLLFLTALLSLDPNRSTDYIALAMFLVVAYIHYRFYRNRKSSMVS